MGAKVFERGGYGPHEQSLLTQAPCMQRFRGVTHAFTVSDTAGSYPNQPVPTWPEP